MREILKTIVEALKAEEQVALVTVIRSIGSTPRHAAAKMAVKANGSFVGTIGGGAMEHKAIQDALNAMTEGQDRLLEYPLIGATPQSLGLCGGTQEVFIDVLNGHSESKRQAELLAIFETVLAAYEAGEPAALITVIRSYNGADWQVGEKAALCNNRSVSGIFDDNIFAPIVIAMAQDALRKNRPIRLGFQPKSNTFTMLNSLNREALELFVDVIQPKLELLIIGAGHIGLALAELGRILGMRVTIVDDRPEWIGRLPKADEAILVSYNAANEKLEPLPVSISPSSVIVVATWGWDGPALEQIAALPAAYIGLVASRRKAKIIFDGLVEKGVTQQALDRIQVPAGLDLGAETPAEIALSIAAEILLLQRSASGRSLTEIK